MPQGDPFKHAPQLLQLINLTVSGQLDPKLRMLLKSIHAR